MTESTMEHKQIDPDMRWVSDSYNHAKPALIHHFQKLQKEFESESIKSRFPDLIVIEPNDYQFTITLGGHRAIISLRLFIIGQATHGQLEINTFDPVGSTIENIERVHISEKGSVIDLKNTRGQNHYLLAEYGFEDLALHFICISCDLI